jgi:hypothetical protein
MSQPSAKGRTLSPSCRPTSLDDDGAARGRGPKVNQRFAKFTWTLLCDFMGVWRLEGTGLLILRSSCSSPCPRDICPPTTSPKSLAYRSPSSTGERAAGTLTPSPATDSAATFGFDRRTSKPGSKLIEESPSGSSPLTSSLLSHGAAAHHRGLRCPRVEG